MVVIFVVGPTGCGKSQLAIDICTSGQALLSTSKSDANKKKFEIINADVLQMYKGLDIITNKVTEDEKQGITHHMMDFRDAHVDDFIDIREFVQGASKLIGEICERGNIPVVVGGTHYYIQHLMFKTRLSEMASIDVDGDGEYVQSGEEDATGTVTIRDEAVLKLLNLSDDTVLPMTLNLQDEKSHQLYEWLQALDPKVAERFHENDNRRLENALRNGNTSEAASINEPLRFQNTLVYCIYPSDMTEFDGNLDKRVDKMIQNGLLDELQSFWSECHDKGTVPDLSKGIFQAIGFKEWIPYLQNVDILEKRDSLLSECKERVKISTRQYSRKQIKWIRNQLVMKLKLVSHYLIPIASHPSQWTTRVVEEQLIPTLKDRLFNSTEEGDDEWFKSLPALLTPKSETPSFAKKRFVCEHCPTTFILGDEETFQRHLASRSHRRRLAGKEKNKKKAKVQNE